jgi:nucleoporin NDC1
VVKATYVPFAVISPLTEEFLIVYRSWDRPRLNERPIYLTSTLLTFAIVQSFIHLFYDYDRVSFPVTKTVPQPSGGQSAQATVPPLVQLKAGMPQIVSRALQRAILTATASPLVYAIFFRRTAWSWTYFFAKAVWKLPKASTLSTIPPLHILLLLRGLTSGFMLLFLWEIVNQTFGLYVAQEPVKRGKPLTEGTRDPNGILLNGLKSRRDVTKVRELPETPTLLVLMIEQAFAFWELVYISQRFPVRRRSFFEDIDRKGGSTWSQILAACLGEIEGINTRIQETLRSPAPAPAPQQPQPVQNPKPLPRIASPLREGKVFKQTAPSHSTQEMIGNFTKSIGQDPLPPGSGSPLDPKRLIQRAHASLPERRQEALAKEIQNAKLTLDNSIIAVIRSYVGHPFRRTVQRRAAAVILGGPFGDLGTIVDAVDSIARLAVSSLTEDPFGKVQADVPAIIRTYTSTINNIKIFKEKVPVDWTDVELVGREGAREMKEADLVLEALRAALRDVLKGFGEYADDMGMSIADMRMAREAATDADVTNR